MRALIGARGNARRLLCRRCESPPPGMAGSGPTGIHRSSDMLGAAAGRLASARQFPDLAFSPGLPHKRDTTREAPMDFVQARNRMVDGQVRTGDVTDLRLLAAMLEL